MKIKLGKEQGSVIIGILLASVVIGYVLAAYLSLVNSQNLASTRSLAWNSCMPVVEAGNEDGLT